jgi:hypothetical protein
MHFALSALPDILAFYQLVVLAAKTRPQIFFFAGYLEHTENALLSMDRQRARPRNAFGEAKRSSDV